MSASDGFPGDRVAQTPARAGAAEWTAGRLAIKSLAGAVLAGGRSRRMGEDKALLTVHGEPLWQRQRRVLRAAGAAPVALVRRPGQPELGAGEWHVRDEFADAGPLAGLHIALKTMPMPAGWLAVLAVDMPAIDVAWWTALLARCGEGCGAVGHHADGFEPLAAIYPRSALAIVTAQLTAGHYALQATIAELVKEDILRVREIAETERGRLTNWNSPADCR